MRNAPRAESLRLLATHRPQSAPQLILVIFWRVAPTVHRIQMQLRLAIRHAPCVEGVEFSIAHHLQRRHKLVGTITTILLCELR